MLLIYPQIQIIPIWIRLFDQTNFPGAFPRLDLVFAGFGGFTRLLRFAPDKPMNIVLAPMGTATALTMFENAARQIIRVTAIQSTILPVCQKINPKWFPQVSPPADPSAGWGPSPVLSK